MHVFDASSMIYGWDNYPLEQFPGLWNWLGSEIAKQELVMPVVAFDEVCAKTPDCGQWLHARGLEQLPIGNATLQASLLFKGVLGIAGDRYGPGVGENDLLIIATAKTHQSPLVSNEKRQNILPDNRIKYKIPAVCGLDEVKVSCIDFLDYLKQSKQIFR